MNTVVKVTREMNINQVLFEAYTHATDNTSNRVHNNALTILNSAASLDAVEDELFVFWTANGTESGSWTVRFQCDEKIQARLDADEYIVDTNIIDVGSHFVLQGWVVSRKSRG